MPDTPMNGAAVDAARESASREVIRALPVSVEFRDDEDTDKRPILSGYFSRFNEWTEINSYFEGRFLERIAPNAYDKTFRERGDEIRVLFEHGHDPNIGNKPIAEIELLEKRDEGAYHESRLLDGVPELIVSGLRAGLYGQSFRMEVMREEFVERPERSDHNPDGLPERTIKEIRLHEFGPVTFPAYKNTTAGLRSMTDEFVFGWLARHPERARGLLNVELTRTALAEVTTNITSMQEALAEVVNGDLGVALQLSTPAPSAAGAAPTGTPAIPERRDPGHSALLPTIGRRSALDV